MSISRRGGPRTATGRLRASRNARKDGLLAAEFVFSTDERSQYDDLRHELSTELKPNTPVLALLFELVVASAWRIKLASRCEQRAVLAHLQSAQNPTAMQAGGSTLSTSPGERSERMKLLQGLREHFERCGYIPGELEQPIVQAFGLEFWKMLAEWNPVNYQITYLAMATIYRRETFGTDPLEGITAEEQEKARDFEPQTHREMILKLLDHEIRCLTAGTRDTEQVLTSGASGQQQDRLDLYLRYHTSARREFYRALKAYREEQVRMKSPSLRQRSKS